MTSTTIFAIASLHGLHKDNPTFSYDHLFDVIAKFKPDFVGVEIRQEDIGADETYLSKNYPYEMVELSKRYRDRCFGFDWLGEDIAGQPIPDNYWKEISAYKKLERQLGEDPDFQDSPLLESLYNQQMDIATTATPSSLIDGRYGKVTKQYYQAMDDLLRGTKYEDLSHFRRRRDEEIGGRMVNFIREHPGSRIALVMGANHHVFAMETITSNFKGGKVKFEVPE